MAKVDVTQAFTQSLEVVESATWKCLNWFLGEGSRPRKGRSYCMPRIFQNHKVGDWSREGEGMLVAEALPSL